MSNNILFSKQKITDKFLEINNKNIKVIINYIKDLIKVVFTSFDSFLEKNNFNSEKENNEIIHQLNNYIIKLENDIKAYIKQVFQYKIQKDAFQCNITKFKEMKEEFDSLKEKVKYKNGKFLKDDRKDNEIFILRKENSNLKNEIEKADKILKQYKEEILKKEKIIENLNKKIKGSNSKIIKSIKNENKYCINTMFNTERDKNNYFFNSENKYISTTKNNINNRDNNISYRNLSYNNINSNHNININHSTTNNNNIINNNIIINSYNKKEIKYPYSNNKTRFKINKIKDKNLNNSVFALLRKSENGNKKYNNSIIKHNDYFINVKLNKTKFKKYKKVSNSLKGLQLNEYYKEKPINKSAKK